MTLIPKDHMAIIFNTPIIFNAGEVFRFGSLSCIADREGVLHRIADPSEKRSYLRAPITKAGSSPPDLGKNYFDELQGEKTSTNRVGRALDHGNTYNPSDRGCALVGADSLSTSPTRV